MIDPALSYSTYLGGNSADAGRDIAVDSSGNVYLTGQAYSTNFPTLNPIQNTFGGGFEDAFVTKINAAGTALVYSTYLGGSNMDYGSGIAVDSSGNAYVTGQTYSTNFPTANPIQGTFGGNSDAFATKINAGGTALIYSTYLGGSGDDYGNGIAVGLNGDAYLTGATGSNNFPTHNPIQSTYGGGTSAGGDAFATRIDPSGTALVYSTYLGGNNDEVGGGIAVDMAGNAYLTGYTASANFPTANPIQPISGGAKDVFISKINAAGTAFFYSSYLGSGGDDSGSNLAVDSAGNVYLTGYTTSSEFPTLNPIQATRGALAPVLSASSSRRSTQFRSPERGLILTVIAKPTFRSSAPRPASGIYSVQLLAFPPFSLAFQETSLPPPITTETAKQISPFFAKANGTFSNRQTMHFAQCSLVCPETCPSQRILIWMGKPTSRSSARQTGLGIT